MRLRSFKTSEAICCIVTHLFPSNTRRIHATPFWSPRGQARYSLVAMNINMVIWHTQNMYRC